MAVTQNTYTGNGSTVLFSFTFPYLETTDIKVSVNGTNTTAYTLANATTIQFNTAPANGAAIRIYRQTDDSALAATFYPGSAIRSSDLNENFTQNLYVTQESSNNATSATTTANTALTNSNTAISTANSAVSTANTASTNASAAVATANTASTNASAAVSTANTASTNATAAVNTANTASTNASNAVTTANTALSTANTASSNASAAVATANTASSNASAAVSTANTASSNATTAVNTANTALSTANAATATANTASTNATAALNAVASSLQYVLVANVAGIPSSPANNYAIEVADSTGIESFSPLANRPAGFVGDVGLSVRMQYSTTGPTWNWLNYFPNNAETRYLKLAGGTLTGQLRADDSTSVASPVIAFDGDTNTGIAHTGADELALVTSGTARVTVDPSGAVAVTNSLSVGGQAAVVTNDARLSDTRTPTDNTVSTAKIVDGAVTSAKIADGTIVNGDINASAAIAGTKISPDFGSQTVTTTGTSSAASFIPSGSTVPTNGLYLPSANSVAISTGGSGRLFIDSSGRLGVGTSSPALFFDCAGTGTGVAYFRTTDTGSSNNINIVNGSNFSAGVIGVVSGTGGSGGDVYGLGHSANPSATDLTPVLTWTSGNRVGIGTSAPTQALDVNGNIKVGANQRVMFGPAGYEAGIKYSTNGTLQISARAGEVITFNNGEDGAERLRITSTGLVGIGTSSVSALLHAKGAGGSTSGSELLRLETTQATGGNWISFTDASARKGYIGYKETADDNFYIANEESGHVVIPGTTRLGLGTSSPGSKLEIAGTSGSAALGLLESGVRSWAIRAGGAITNKLDIADLTAGQTRLTIDSSGNVGIGTTSAISKLHVSNSGAEGFEFTPGSTSNTNLLTHYNRNGSFVYVNSQVSAASHQFFIGASEAARIDASSRLLVGTSSSAGSNALSQISGVGSGTRAKLELFHWEAGGGASQLIFSQSRGGSFGSYTAVNSGDELGGLFFQGSNGSAFGIGARIDAVADAAWGSGDHPARLVFSTTADGASSPTERMRITNGGSVYFGVTSDPSGTVGGSAFLVAGSDRKILRLATTTTAAVGLAEFYNANGSVGAIATSGTSTSFNTSSDYRLKENVTAVTDGITRLQQLKPSRFNFIADPAKTVDGFLAHEVQSVVPEAITGEKDAVDDDGNPIYQGIDQSKLVPLLTAALQEAVAKIESLEARLTAAGI